MPSGPTAMVPNDGVLVTCTGNSKLSAPSVERVKTFSPQQPKLRCQVP